MLNKRFNEMHIADEEIVKYTVWFHLNGNPTQVFFESFPDVLDYLDYVVDVGGDVTNVQIIEECKLTLE